MSIKRNSFLQLFGPGAVFYLLLCSACAPLEPPRKRYFWPPGPFTTPRIEYIDFYGTDTDLKRGTENRLVEGIFGKEVPRPIFRRPQNIASDGKGRVFVTDIEVPTVFILDFAEHAVRRLEPQMGSEKRYQTPGGVAVNASGEVFVVDSKAGEVFHFSADELLVKTFGKGELVRPTSLTADAARDRVYVVDTGAHRIVVFGSDGTPLFSFGQRGEGPGEFNYPLDIDLGYDGNLYVLDSMNARVQVFDGGGNHLRSFGGRGLEPGLFQIAKGLAVGPSGQVYVSDTLGNRVTIFDTQGNLLLTFGGRSPELQKQVAPGGFYMLQGIDVDDADRIWAVDGLSRMVHRFQYLNDRYLAEHPILPGQAVVPAGFPARGAEADPK